MRSPLENLQHQLPNTAANGNDCTSNQKPGPCPLRLPVGHGFADRNHRDGRISGIKGQEAVAAPFYAAKINAFRQVAVGRDDYVTTYTCTGAIVFAVAGGVVALALIVLTVSSFVLRKKETA